MFSLNFWMFLFTLYLVGFDYAICKFKHIQFTKKLSYIENAGSGLIKGLKVHSLPQCASTCAGITDCTSFNFYQPCPSVENLEINCKLYSDSEDILTSNPCCFYYSMVSEVTNIKLKTTSVTPQEIASEAVVITEKTTSIATPDPYSQTDFEDWNSPAGNEMQESATLKDFEWNQPETSWSTQPNRSEPSSPTPMSQPGPEPSSPSGPTTQPSNVQEIQAKSMADFKAMNTSSFLSETIVPTVQCNKTENLNFCIVKTANWSAAVRFCMQYNNEKGQPQLAVILNGYIDYVMKTAIKNSTVCPPYCTFWIGLQGTGTAGLFPHSPVNFEWGPWVDYSKYDYNNWETDYPKQEVGNHYAYIQADTGYWRSDVSDSKEMPFLCVGP